MEQLGQIHYWMYSKIVITAQREQRVYEEAQKTIEDLADELHETAVETYGKPVDPTVPLESIIDVKNIHGWLARHLEKQLVREASFIKDIADCGGPDGVDAVKAAFAAHGAQCGDEAAKLLSAGSTGEDVYRVMQSFYANGMPCDGGDEPAPCGDGEYAFYGDFRHQKPHWHTAGADDPLMIALYEGWFTNFVEHAAPGKTFTKNEVQGRVVYTIK